MIDERINVFDEKSDDDTGHRNREDESYPSEVTTRTREGNEDLSAESGRKEERARGDETITTNVLPLDLTSITKMSSSGREKRYRFGT